MRAMTEWWIFKDYHNQPDHWDGPFKKKAEAIRTFNKFYRCEGKVQDFVVVKVTLTPQPTPKAKR